ncbi:hypothetical protein T492DRAFT_860044 [Pavlovales sp. CCMP2436]|nr:hypothetical protein T492DRAFT_860044 [Pavlovales sp. CCMP2436]
MAPSGRDSTRDEADVQAQLDDEAYRAEHSIEVDGNNARSVRLARCFDNVTDHFDARIVSALKALFANPTPVQAVSWPLSMRGSDLVAVAETCCDALVLAPTRELAAQIEQVGGGTC